MSRFLVTALGAAILLGALSSLGLAGQPDPNQSTWDNIVGVSPKNNCSGIALADKYAFRGTVRDNAGVPIPGFPASQLELDFGLCTELSTRPGDQIPADGDSDANGDVIWRVNLGFGGNDPCSVKVLVQNVVFKTLIADQANPGGLDGGVRSPDGSGDGLVALGDLVEFQQEFVNTGVRHDYRGDLNSSPFDGLTSLGDLVRFQKHFVGVCP